MDGRRKLRTSDVVIGVLLVAVIILAYPKIFHQGRSHIPREMRGKISIAVMPFKNVTGDTIFSLWQEGMQNLMITALSNSPELSVRQFETMNSAIASRKDINFASFSPSMIRKLAQQLEANTVISGSLHKSGDKIRITANIMNAGTEEIYKSYVLDGHTEDDFFALADSMSLNIRNFLEIRNMSRDSHFDTGEIFTQSADAYKLYIQGLNCHTQLDYVSAAENYNKAIQADTSFVSAMLKLAYCYGDMRQAELSKSWAYRAANHYDQLPPDMQILVNAVKAAVDKRPLEQLKYCRQYLDLDPHSNYMTYLNGWINFNLEQWAEAIEAFEQSLELLNKLDSHPWSWTYILLGRAYHFEGLFKKESKIYETGRELWPDQSATFDYWEAISAVSQGDSVRAATLLGDIHKDLTRKGWPEANLMLWYAGVYAWADANDKAEEYYRKALSMRPENEQIMYEFANFLISNDRNVEEGMDLIAPLVENYPANAQFLYVYGLGLSKREEFLEARDVLNRAWELRPWYDHKHFVLSKKIDDLLNSV